MTCCPSRALPARKFLGVTCFKSLALTNAGTNFGPAASPLVQWVRVSSPIAEYATLGFEVLTDSVMDVVIAAGVGKNLSFSLRVAGQDAPASPATFDYLSPAILSIVPPIGPTFSSTGFPVQACPPVLSPAAYLSSGPIENNIMVFVTSACARRTGVACQAFERRRSTLNHRVKS
jgi:hypothetical protein